MNVGLNQILKLIALSILFLFLLGIGNMDTYANEADLTKATFYVY